MFDSIIDNKRDYRLQIIYTQINRDSTNTAHFKTYKFDAEKYYYYCASIFKLPAAVFAIERLNDLNLPLCDSFSVANTQCPAMNYSDTMYRNFGNLIEQLLMLSDNDAFNPIYDFITPERFNQRLKQFGYKSAVICRRFAVCSEEQNLCTNKICFFDSSAQMKFMQDCVKAETLSGYKGLLNPHIGKQYFSAGNLVKQPFNFTHYNYISLSDAHDLLVHIVFPKTAKKDVFLRSTDYDFLLRVMSQFPSVVDSIKYNEQKYPDNYMKYFVALDSAQYHFPENLRIYNKVGQAYGFLTDCSYVQDTLNKVEFFLSASMYVNKDETLNDGVYEYDQTALPFFRNLFNVIYEYELLRKKEHLPIFEK
ncbi:MAG TPA: serine hydrolase [Chitinophagales bacterium]